MSNSACQNRTVDQAFAILLNPIRDLSQNWEIDISKILDEYLEKICFGKNYKSRSSDLSFTEAAMVIQGSVNIYSRKVDYFEKILLQALSDLGNGSSIQENTNMVDAIKKGRVKNNNLLSLNELEFKNLNNIQIGKNIELVDKEEFSSLNNGYLKFLPANSYQLCEKGENNRSNEIEMLEGGEYIGSKMDFYVNFCCLTPEGSLSIDPTFKPLQDIPILDCNESFVDPVQEKNGSDICNEFANAEQNLPEAISENSNLDIVEMHNSDEAELQTQITKDITNNISQEKDLITTIKLPNGRSSLCKGTRKSKQQSHLWHQIDVHTCPLPDRPVRSGKIRRLIPCQCHTIRKRKRYNPKLYMKDKVLGKSGLMPVDDFISLSLHKFKNTRHLKVPPEIVEEANNERKKRENILKARKTSLEETNIIEDQDISVLRGAINKALNENIEDDYDQLILDDDLQTEMSFCDAENLSLDPAIPPDHIQLQEDETDLVFEPITQEEWNLIGDHLYEPCTRYESILQRKMAHLMLGAQKVLAFNELLQRVNRWRSIIMPKLETDEKRKHFDIHAYGSEIISKFSEIGETLTFEEIAMGFPQKDVSRVFLSCLMLGNSYNMKLFSSGGNPSMDDLEMTLLSKVQQHQQMEEYAAPSQQQTAAPYQNITASTAVDHATSKRKQLTSDSGIFSTMEESTVLSQFSTLEETTAHRSQQQPTPKHKSSESMVIHHSENKKRNLTSDSGILSTIDDSTAPSRLSTLEESTALEFQQPALPKRKRTESILNKSKGNKKKKVTFDPATFLSTLGGASFSFSNI